MVLMMRSFILLAGLLPFLFLIASCHTPPPSSVETVPNVRSTLFEYSLAEDQVTGVAISPQARIFICFPRWGKDPESSVAEMLIDGTLIPFPNRSWNSWQEDSGQSPREHFVCVQSVYIDDNGKLWILDPASPSFKGVVPGGAKLVKVNLQNNQVEQVIHFDEKIAPTRSYLNDVRVDTDKNVAYITDSGAGAIIVVNLDDGTSRRVLVNHPSTLAEEGYIPVVHGRALLAEDGQPPKIHADGIALDSQREFLYYHPLTGKGLYRIRTRFLNDPILTDGQLGQKVQKVADTGAVDGMFMGENDVLYLTMLEDGTIKRLTPKGELVTVVQDDRIQWPDSISISPDNYLYFTDSQINRMPRFNGGIDRRTTPYKLYKVQLPMF